MGIGNVEGRGGGGGGRGGGGGGGRGGRSRHSVRFGPNNRKKIPFLLIFDTQIEVEVAV